MSKYLKFASFLLFVSLSQETPVPEYVSIGNSYDTNVKLSTGKAGIFSGNSGNIQNVAASSNNKFAPTGQFTDGSIELGNTKGVALNSNTGRGNWFGDGGNVEKLNVASNNGVTGGTAANGGTALVVSNVINSTMNADTGKGGFLGGDGGDAKNSTLSSGNSVNLNSANSGQVGVTQNGKVSMSTGRGKMFGSGSDVNNVQQSSNNNVA